MLTFDELHWVLQKLSPHEIQELVRPRLKPEEARAFDALTKNVSPELLVLIGARTLSRQR